jgi:hypothetical protein
MLMPAGGNMTVQRLFGVGVVTLATLAGSTDVAAEKLAVQGRQNFLSTFTGTIDAETGAIEVMENRRRCSGTYRARWGWGMLKCPPFSYSYELPDGITPGGRVVVEDSQGDDFVLQIGGPVEEAKDAKSANVPRK